MVGNLRKPHKEPSWKEKKNPSLMMILLRQTSRPAPSLIRMSYWGIDPGSHGQILQKKMCQTHLQRTKEGFTCVTFIQTALKYVFISPPITFIIFLEASTLKLCSCVRLAMMVWVLIEMANGHGLLRTSNIWKRKKWFKLVRGKLIKLELPAKSSHCRAWSILPSRELNFTRTRTSSQTRAQTH